MREEVRITMGDRKGEGHVRKKERERKVDRVRGMRWDREEGRRVQLETGWGGAKGA